MPLFIFQNSEGGDFENFCQMFLLLLQMNGFWVPVILEVLPINVNFETFYYEHFQVYIKEQFMLIWPPHVLSFSLNIILHLLIFFHLSTHYLFFPGTF